MAKTKKPPDTILYVVSLLGCHAKGTVHEFLLVIRRPINLDPEKETSLDKRRLAYKRLNAFVEGMREIFLKRHDELISEPSKIVCNTYPLGNTGSGTNEDVKRLQNKWRDLYCRLHVTREDKGRPDELLDWQQEEMEQIAKRIESKVSGHHKKQSKKQEQAQEQDQPRLF